MAVNNHSYIIWDFDGTLAQRAGMWSGTLLEVLQANGFGASVTAADIRPFLTTGFRWHNAHVTNCAGTSAEQWWNELHPLFEHAFRQAGGVIEADARRLAQQVRGAYANPAKWSLFPDVRATLDSLAEKGWRHVLLTNHVPELRGLLRALQIEDDFAAIFNSADTGIEKPHLEAFQNVRATLPPGATLWMIGDNIAADVHGAEAAGIPAILVRKHHASAKRFAETLAHVIPILEAGL